MPTHHCPHSGADTCYVAGADVSGFVVLVPIVGMALGYLHGRLVRSSLDLAVRVTISAVSVVAIVASGWWLGTNPAGDEQLRQALIRGTMMFVVGVALGAYLFRGRQRRT